MTLADTVIPGTILVLKFVTKTMAGQKPRPLVLIQAIVSLPIDIVFMALSFIAAAITLAHRYSVAMRIELLLGIFVLCIVISFICSWLTHLANTRLFSNTEDALTNYFGCVFFLLAFIISLSAIGASLIANAYVGDLIAGVPNV